MNIFKAIKWKSVTTETLAMDLSESLERQNVQTRMINIDLQRVVLVNKRKPILLLRSEEDPIV